LREFAYQGLLVQLLPVLDDLQRALAAASEEREDDPLLKGVRLVEQKFASVLERIGVTPFGASGEPFDPKIHEAVDVDAGSAGDTIVDVYQTGYRLGQSLIRPAMVKVGGKSN
jgi:molecular chaperone GrpE